jgi:hypothetical protein
VTGTPRDCASRATSCIFRSRRIPKEARDHGLDLGPPHDAIDEDLERRIPQLLGMPQPVEQGPPLVEADDDHPHPAVAAGVDRPHAGPLAMGVDAELGVEGDGPIGHAGRRLLHGHVEPLPAAGLLALVNRSQDPEGGGDARRVVGLRAGRDDGWPVRRTGAEHHAPQRVPDHVRSLEVAIRAGLTEVADGSEDQPRVALEDCLGVEAARGQRARTPRFDPDVGLCQLAMEQVAAALAVEVEHGAALARVSEGEVEAAASIRREGRPPSRRRAGRRLDAKHRRAQVREQSATQLAAQVGAVHDSNSREGSLALLHPSDSPRRSPMKRSPATHSPVNLGSRFSLNARGPSRASLDCITAAETSFSTW